MDHGLIASRADRAFAIQAHDVGKVRVGLAQIRYGPSSDDLRSNSNDRIEGDIALAAQL